MLSPAARPAAGGRPLPRMAARRRVAYGALDGKGGEGGGGKGGGEGTSTGGSGEEGLALDRISIYLHGYCSKPDQPTDLVRRTPETALWFAVLEERRSIDDLSDAEVDGLRYLLSGVDASSATADVRERLRQKKDAAWTIKYTCARARHTGCPFALEFRHRAGASTVDVWATERHHFHDPTSADSLAHLKMAPEVEEQLRLLFAAGAKPYASWVAVNCNNL
ncbi:hypothetical protein ABPG75_005875, partial [Micractinium tetrahymenae]